MRRAPGLIAMTALAVVLAGCSESSEPEPEETPSSESSASESPSAETSESPADEETPASGVAPAVEEGVAARLAAADGLFGTASADPQVLGLEEFNAGAPPEQLAALEERGFVAGAFEQVDVPRTADAVRVVIAFEDAAGAKADVQSGIEDQPGEGEVERFDVPGVPGAEGFDVFGQQGLIGRNVAFNVGEYELILGVATQQPADKPQVERDEIAQVAQDWYAEVRGLD